MLFGVLAALVLGGFALPERSAAVGDGFLVLEFMAIGVLICVPLAIVAACWVLLRPAKNTTQLFSASRSVLLLGQ